MSMISPRTILVATDEGLHLVNGDGAARVDDLGREVGALAPAGDGWWALVVGGHLLLGPSGRRARRSSSRH